MKGQRGGTLPVPRSDNHDIAVLGHELSNVLNGLLGMAGLLRESDLQAEQEQWLKAIEYSGRQLHSLIETFQSSNGDPGQCVLPRITRVDGVALLEQVIISHTPAARANENRLLLVVDPDVPGRWRCDPCMVRQLLDNLVGNANKYTRAGEVIIEVTVVHGTATAPRMMELRVTDTGPGIKAANKKRMFEAYQRNYGGDGRVEGKGLGLFICRNIVKALNGRIDWTSPEGGGSCFDVVLPGILGRGDGRHSALPTSLLTQVRCQLALDHPLERSVANFLTRLGVGCFNDRSASQGRREDSLEVLISEAGTGPDCGAPAILLTPLTPPGIDHPEHLLCAPILESTLGPVLLEMALEWLGARRMSQK
jgi:anti-sigma regulatory factor (Ser/Thr protein kinase)